MDQIKIRRALPEEVSQLQYLNDEIFVDNSKYDSDLKLDWAQSDKGKKYFSELITNSQSICLVAEINMKLIGYIAASEKEVSYRNSKYIEIGSMGVTPVHQSHGIGKLLMDECIKQAKEMGYQKAYINCYAKNTKALDFYKRAGFDIIDVCLDKLI